MDCTGITGKTKRLPITRRIRACPAAKFSAFWMIGAAGFGSAPRRGYPGSIRTTGRFRNYDTSDGLQSNNFSGGCYEDSQSGEMLFGGNNGITTFFPENIRDNPYVPPVVLTSFKIFNKPVPIDPKSVLKKAIPYADSLTLSYRDNVFSFEFAALSYANSQKNRYRYRLENLEPGWNEVGSKQRLANYTNLDPGKYVFRVQASNSDGMWNEEGVSLPILITPPWWRTNWFRGLFAVVILTLLWAAYQLRVRQLLHQFTMTLEAARRRANTHRAGTARYTAAKLSGVDAPLSNRGRDASGTPNWMPKKPSKALSIGRIRQSAKAGML